MIACLSPLIYLSQKDRLLTLWPALNRFGNRFRTVWNRCVHIVSACARSMTLSRACFRCEVRWRLRQRSLFCSFVLRSFGWDGGKIAVPEAGGGLLCRSNDWELLTINRRRIYARSLTLLLLMESFWVRCNDDRHAQLLEFEAPAGSLLRSKSPKMLASPDRSIQCALSPPFYGYICKW